MDTKEVITLSSDEENDLVNSPKTLFSYLPSEILVTPSTSIVHKKESIFLPQVHCSASSTNKTNCVNKSDTITPKFIFKENNKMCRAPESLDQSPSSPEIVDIDDCVEVFAKENHNIIQNNKYVKNHIESPIYQNSESCNSNNSVTTKTEDNHTSSSSVEKEINCKPTKYLTNGCKLLEEPVKVEKPKIKLKTINKTDEIISNEIIEVSNNETKISEESNSYPHFFVKFLDCCASLEEVESDRLKLLKKLKKRFDEADTNYTRSKEFETVIAKLLDKVNKNNLYLIAKEINDELTYRKKLLIDCDDSKINQNGNENEENSELSEVLQKKSKKKARIIRKIMRNLRKLGDKIHELEEAEVDLSDEEDSSYVKLQRYRERFVQVYKKLCEYTGQVSDAKRVYSRKICFSGSKYPEINRCIEMFLNKTKRFPDFIDIVKLLESQSSVLGLPSNKDSLRILATDIFQKVGQVLQQRRMYDLWDSFSSYLNDSSDPANYDPELNKILLKNFETREKKEQEIFKYYADLQEKQHLEPEEIPEEEANESPESGNEEEKEIDEIEKNISKKLDVIDTEETTNAREVNGKESSVEIEDSSSDSSTPERSCFTSSRETKNNYRNCKSLKWRNENKVTSKLENVKKLENADLKSGKTDKPLNLYHISDDEESQDKVDIKNRSKIESETVETIQDDSDPDCICVGSSLTEEKFEKLEPLKEPKIKNKDILKNENKTPNKKSLGSFNYFENVLKRSIESENKQPVYRKKKCLTSLNKLNIDAPLIVEIDNENEYWKENTKEITEVFDIYYCHIEQNFENINNLSFREDCIYKKEKSNRGKVFRDLTNLNHFMKSNERKTSLVGLFSRYYRGFQFEKPSWKKRFKANPKFNGSKNQKCALSHEENGKENLGGGERNSKEKEIQRNAESGGKEGSYSFSGNGSGSEDDNNDNGENKRNGKLENDDIDERKFEEEEEEDRDEDNEEDINGDGEHRPDVESNLHSSEINHIMRASENTSVMNIDGKSNYEPSTNQHILIPNSASTNNIRTHALNENESFRNILVLDTVNMILEINNQGVEVESVNFREDYANNDIGNPEENFYIIQDPGQNIAKQNNCENSKRETSEKKINSESHGKYNESEIMVEEIEDNSLRVESIENIENLHTMKNIKIMKVRNVEQNEEQVENNQNNTGKELMDKSKTNEIRKRRYTKNKINKTEINGSNELTIVESSEKKGKKCSSINNKKKERKNCRNVTKNNQKGKKTPETELNKKVKQKKGNGEINNGNKQKRSFVSDEEIKIEENFKWEKRNEVDIEIHEPEKTEMAQSSLTQSQIAKENYGNYKNMEEGESMNNQEDRRPVRRRSRGNPNKFGCCNSVKKEFDDVTLIQNKREQKNTKEAILSRLKEKSKKKIDLVELNDEDINLPKIIYENISHFNKDLTSQEFKYKESPCNERNTSKAENCQTEKDSYVDYIVQKIRKTSNSNVFSQSDEERVKNFLLHSPSSISITPPKQLTRSKPPSEAALQALATLRGLKGISATRIISRPKIEDDVVLIEELPNTRRINSETTESKRRRSQLPVISDVQSINSASPKIITVQGNASEYGSCENPWYNDLNNGEETGDYSSLKISNVWGNLPDNFIQDININESMAPGCSYHQDNPSSSNLLRRKSITKKNVEYVVLE